VQVRPPARAVVPPQAGDAALRAAAAALAGPSAR
jgi:hypothetical protein